VTTETIVVLGLLAALVPLLGWGFLHLPRERWQFLAAVPLKRREDGRWDGLNLTYYGVFNATALLLALVSFLLLMGALGAARDRAVLVLALVLGIALPAARLVARLVERKRNTFTVGGASFLGLLASPLAVWLANTVRWSGQVPTEPLALVPTLAALCTAYSLGEGVGRLACISFGCCYGKRLTDTGPLTRRLFAAVPFRFAGATRKIAYASGWENTPVVPIQAVTSVVCLGIGLGGMALLLGGAYRTALLLTGVGSQLWRVGSECLRADHRGAGRLSAYQAMGLTAAIFTAAIALWTRVGTPALSPPDALAGLRLLWHPGMLLLLQALWAAMFLYTGRSTVTGSCLSFHVHHERV
jgi:prolipoprotein diacylglyceryltransferase